jgi:rubrerythrin
MKESNIEYTLPQESNSDYVKYLEQEAWKMDKRIEGLENELKIYKEEDKVVNRIIEIERDLEQIRTDIRTLNENNESNSPTYIIFCNII